MCVCVFLARAETTSFGLKIGTRDPRLALGWRFASRRMARRAYTSNKTRRAGPGKKAPSRHIDRTVIRLKLRPHGRPEYRWRRSVHSSVRMRGWQAEGRQTGCLSPANPASLACGIMPDRVAGLRNTQCLTRPGVGAWDNRGRFDSQPRMVRAAPRGPGRADPLSPPPLADAAPS